MAASSPGKVAKCCSCLCSPRVLLTFGVPLLVPSVILVAIAFVSFPDFGVIHISGILLLIVSIVCICFGALILICVKLKRTMTPPSEKSPVDDSSISIPDKELSCVEVKRDKKVRRTSRHKPSNGSVKNKGSPRRTKPKRKNSRGAKDAVMNNSVKLPTVNEDNEGERLRILSAGGVSRKALPTIPCDMHIKVTSSEDSRRTSVTGQRSLSTPRVEVWKEPSIMSARSELSIVSDSSIYFTQDVELTPVEVLGQNSCFLAFPMNPPTRSLSLTNILEGSSSDNTDMDSRRRSGSLSDETSFIILDGLNKTECLTNDGMKD